jgi:UDP-glucuronate decarboxylase
MRSCYDEGKRCAETLFFDYNRQLGLSIKVARIFNTYGPRMHPDDGRVVSNFVVQALTGRPITLYGDGSQTRAFCYVDDLVDGLVRLMESPEDLTGPVNLGNPVEWTVAELAEKVLELTGSKSEIRRAPLPSDDPTQRCPDIGLARRALGWEPRMPLEEGLKRTIEHDHRALRRSAPPQLLRRRRLRRPSPASSATSPASATPERRGGWACGDTGGSGGVDAGRGIRVGGRAR